MPTIDFPFGMRLGEKASAPGGGGVGGMEPPPPPSLSAVPGGGCPACRPREGVSTPTSTAQNDTHVALII